MAQQNSVSPGVYVSERELQFNQQAVGVTTLGSAGETLKGPGIEPIFVQSYDEYKTIFGGQDPTLITGSNRPKYEQSYIAKSWLSESNSMWVARPLGYSGYDAGDAWSISLKYIPDTDNVFRAGLTGTDGSGAPVTQSPSFNDVGGGIPGVLANTQAGPTQSAIGGTNEFGQTNSNPWGMYSGGTWGYHCQSAAGSATIAAGCTGNQIGDGFQINHGTYPIATPAPWETATQENGRFRSIILSGATAGGPLQLVMTGSSAGDSFVTGPCTGNALAPGCGTPMAGPFLTPATGNGLAADVPLPYPLNLLSGMTFTIGAKGFDSTVNGGTTWLGNASDGGQRSISNTLQVDGPFQTVRREGVTTFSSIVWGPAISIHDDGVNTSTQSPANRSTYGNVGAPRPNVDILGQTATGFTYQLNWRKGNNIGAHSATTANPARGWTAQTSGTVYTWSGQTREMVIATLRSRGAYAGNTFTRNVADGLGPTTDGIVANVSPTFGPWTTAGQCTSPALCPSMPIANRVLNTTNYKQDFNISAKTRTNSSVLYTVNLDPGSQNYITKVLGTSKFDKPGVDFWVEDIYPSSLTNLATSAVTFTNMVLGQTGDYDNYSETYQPVVAQEGPTTPWIMSEVRGNELKKLFRVILIADGNNANRLVKISFQDMEVLTKSFSLVVRDFYDTDTNQIVLESYSQCSMNPESQNYIGKKIGTENGDYPIRSRYIMLEFPEEAPIDAMPAGFQGYPSRCYTGNTSNLSTTFVNLNPPQPTTADTSNNILKCTGYYGNISPKPFYNLTYDTISDTIKRTYLGWSNKKGIDKHFFDYKGLQNTGPTAPTKCGMDVVESWTAKTKGFHLDVRVSGFSNTENLQYDVGAYKFFTSGHTNQSIFNYYQHKEYLKFTVFPYGGLDGWDEYRQTRTNNDTYLIGKSNYGGFWYNSVVINNCEVTDYYSYYDTIRKFANPEEYDISLFTTPSIDYTNNLTLVNKTIEMVSLDRGDSLYVVNSPNPKNQTVSSAVGGIQNAALNTSYAATYWPWIRYNDTENNKRLFIPPTAEVVRSIAVTDNVSFPWFAPAGQRRGVLNTDKAQTKLTQTNRDDLYESRINPIATFNGVGVVIWGQKTLQTKLSALDRVNIRRLMLFLKKKIQVVGIQLLFEQNDDIVRQQFLSLVNPILEGVRRDRGIVEFKVQVSDSASDIDQNKLTGKIFVKPVKTLEFIEVEFNITSSNVSFDDVT